jgi:hypothetical protein
VDNEANFDTTRECKSENGAHVLEALADAAADCNGARRFAPNHPASTLIFPRAWPSAMRPDGIVAVASISPHPQGYHEGQYTEDSLLWEQDGSRSKHLQNIKHYSGLPSSCRCVELVCGLPCGLPDRLRQIATVRDGLNRASAFNFRSSVSLRPPATEVDSSQIAPLFVLSCRRLAQCPTFSEFRGHQPCLHPN